MLAASNEPRAPLGPPQFRLRTLMLAITLCGVLFALMSALGGLSSLMLVLFAALIAAHVAGNVLGTRLRGDADRLSAHEPPPRCAAFVAPVPGAQRLRERTGISRSMIVMAGLGSALGGALGLQALSLTLGGSTTTAALSLGTFSSAVLGGFFGFLLSSFCSVSGRALREALRDPSDAALDAPAGP